MATLRAAPTRHHHTEQFSGILTDQYQPGPVVQIPISANPGLNFNWVSKFLFCSKAFSRIIFSILIRASNHQIVGKKNKTEFAF